MVNMDPETGQEDRYCGSEEMSKVEIGGTQNKKKRYHLM